MDGGVKDGAVLVDAMGGDEREGTGDAREVEDVR